MIAEGLWKLNEKGMPTLKGKVSGVNKVKPLVLLEVAYKKIAQQLCHRKNTSTTSHTK